jgi:hypothetical protein
MTRKQAAKKKKPRKSKRPTVLHAKNFSCDEIAGGFWFCATPDWGQVRLYEKKDIRRLHSYLGKLIAWLDDRAALKRSRG